MSLPARALLLPLLALAGACRSAAPAVPPGFRSLPERWVHPATGIVLVHLPGGTYVQGSPEDEPQRDTDETRHEVTLADDVWLAETEVTIGQWEHLMGVDFDAPPRDPRLPIGDVTWYDAQEFVARLNELGPPGWRLPSDAEWEAACRAGTDTPFSTGPDLGLDQANYDGYYPYHGPAGGTHSTGPTPVRSYPPNPWGLYDLHGNVAEWCADLYRMAPDDPDPEGEGAPRVFRGGAWLSSADQVRSAYREGYPPLSDGGEYGFRVAWSPPAPGTVPPSAYPPGADGGDPFDE